MFVRIDSIKDIYICFKVIPISLRKREERPSRKNSSHKKRKFDKIGAKLKKARRVKKQQDDWSALATEGKTTDPSWK